MLKRTFFVFLIAVMLLTACTSPTTAPQSADQSGGQNQPAGETPKSEAGSSEPVELRLWMHQNQAFIDSYQVLIDKYMEEHPNVTVKVETFEYAQYIQTLQTAMPAGQEADVMQLFGSWVCGYADRLSPAPDFMLADTKDKIYSATLDGFTCDGKLYGVPQEFNIEYGAVLVNKQMFDEAGIAYPPKWENWDQLIADAEKLTKADGGTMKVAGFDFLGGDVLPFQLMAGILQRGGSYMAADGKSFTWNTPQGKETLEMMDAWVKANKVVDPTLYTDENGDSGTTFFQGLSAIAYIGPWAVALGKTNYPDFGAFDYVPVPYLGESPSFSADAGWGLAVSPNSKNQEAAWDLIRYITLEKENALSWTIGTTTVPALIENTQADEIKQKAPWITVVYPYLEHGQFIGYWPDRDQVFYNIVTIHMLNVFQGIETVDQALQLMDEESNATFK